MNFHKITYPDVNNGIGCRVTLWVSGCTHHCPHCHNPQTWDFKSGHVFTEEHKKQLFDIIALPYIKGLTISGGDPIDSVNEVVELCKEVNRVFPNKDLWVYTGYTMQELENDPQKSEILTSGVTTIVDGLFVENLKDRGIPFRGSRNQNIWQIDQDGKFHIVGDNNIR